jgi:lipopolysaccharide transport system permease protein
VNTGTGSTVESLPAKPLLVLEPKSTRLIPALTDVWRHRELLGFLVWRDVAIRYKQAAIGVAWVILQPLLTLIVFSILFGRLARIPSDGAAYPPFIMVALIPWAFISNAITNSAGSLVGSAALLTKVYFPRLLIPTAAVGAALVDLAITSTLLVPVMLYYQVPLGPRLLLVPLALVLLVVLALAVGWVLSAVNVKYRDVRHAVPFFVQLWMFVSPVFYPLSLVPREWRWPFRLNPLTGIIDALRAMILGTRPDWVAISVAVGLTLVAASVALWVFQRMEAEFADII